MKKEITEEFSLKVYSDNTIDFKITGSPIALGSNLASLLMEMKKDPKLKFYCVSFLAAVEGLKTPKKSITPQSE